MIFRGITYSVLSSVKSALLRETYRSGVVRGKAGRVHYSLLRPWECEVSPQRAVPDSVPKPNYASSGYSEEPRTDIEIKTSEQIETLRTSCSLARHILTIAGEAVKVGVTTDEIDELVHDLCISHKAYPSPLNYHGFPKSVCTSVNNVACHGIPDSRRLEDGDIINIDVTVFYNGYHGDCSETFCVGNVDEGGRRLVNIARKCRDEAISVCKDGARFSDIGCKISEIAETRGFTVMSMFCGHGIGQYFHGPPDIIHVAHEDSAVMKEGMTFTVEPVISAGGGKICILEDGWTAMSVDQSRSAQFEHTILITKDGSEILTA
ncbi:methionine aminopeptidase 1D, mitochondrial-like [Liolophura sinensis]|uniref:methionine aminopeptidase 1D, mitochondrial-like n=1 Tax=Liolophura sinensis TaxID=3198878 RepID=UPI0031597D36